MTPRIYLPHEANEIPPPSNPEALAAYAYTRALMLHGTSHYIDNVNTTPCLLLYGKFYIPVTINETEWENSYVCSPYNHYITYAAEELVLVPNKVLRSLLRSIIFTMGALLKRCDINRVIIVNNWLLSTNLYPNLPADALKDIAIFLASKYPQHSIMFRSLNEEQHSAQLKHLSQIGFIPIGSRQVYLWDTTKPHLLSYSARKQLTADTHRLKDNLYTLSTINMNRDSERAAELYSFLYLKKYSYNNPHFNKNYMKMCHDNNIFHFTGLYAGKTLVGVAGIFQLGDSQTAPILGYDTAQPKEGALYRRLSMITYLSAKERKAYFNNSSGVSEFKRFRGCFPSIEYLAVRPSRYRQKIGWAVLRVLVNGIGIPLMRRYRL